MKREDILSSLKSRVQGETQVSGVGGNCLVLEETDSTNDQAVILAKAGAPHGTLVVAETQTAGKGRRGRTWVSKAGEHIYMSLLLRPQIQPANASMLTLIMGLSAAKACRELLREDGCRDADEIKIKWPNDLVWKGRKICGILTEMCMREQEVDYIVIGIGINVNGTDFPPELKEKAASLCMAAGHSLGREELIARTMAHFEEAYELFLQTQDLSALADEYKAFLVNCDREVRVLDPGREYSGIARGINQQGELLVECAGELRRVYAGEVSVRGIYGYV